MWSKYTIAILNGLSLAVAAATSNEDANYYGARSPYSLEHQENLYDVLSDPEYCEGSPQVPFCSHVKERIEEAAKRERECAGKDKPVMPSFEPFCERHADICAEGNRLRVNPETRQLVDQQGRTVLLRGVNAVFKDDPYLPSNTHSDPHVSLNNADIVDLRKWGMNFVRLGVMWEAVERKRGVYDLDFLDRVEDLVNRLGKEGIYTLIDAH